MEEDLKDVFEVRPDDEAIDISKEDKDFLRIMEKIRVNKENHIEAPLPFKFNHPELPNNRRLTFQRQLATLNKLKTKPERLNDCLKAMEKNIVNKYVEEVPAVEAVAPKGGCWYVPVFPVLHPKKKKTRLVYDSAFKCEGISLNSALLTGPNRNNPLRDVLMRFREFKVAFVSDIFGMFDNFHVPEDQRDMQRFFWYSQNDPSNKLVIFRAKTHIFGHTSSPQVSTACLRWAANNHVTEKVPDDVEPFLETAKSFVQNAFYVDDSLGTAPTVEEAVGVLKAARFLLGRYGVRLHKIVANDPRVLAEFPRTEWADEGKIDLDDKDYPQTRTLGISWNTKTDEFEINVNIENKPLTRRGMLSVIQTCYDPLGFVAPIILEGKLLFREALQHTSGPVQWDRPLKQVDVMRWRGWLATLSDLNTLKIARHLAKGNEDRVSETSLHVFVDASEAAIASVIFLKTISETGEVYTGLAFGESKLTPKGIGTIPRKELAAALAGVQAQERVRKALARTPDYTNYYCDSRIVLGYLTNTTSCFTKYVSRRIDMILSRSNASDWHFIPGNMNPAHHGTKATTPAKLLSSNWFTGPAFLKEPYPREDLKDQEGTHVLELPERIPTKTSAYKTLITVNHQISCKDSSPLGSLYKTPKRWTHSWRTLIRLATMVARAIHRFKSLKKGTRTTMYEEAAYEDTAVNLIVREAQQELKSELTRNRLTPSHFLAPLAPYVDSEGLVRVGGRLNLADCPEGTKHPVVLPKKHLITQLVIRHFHESCKHQGFCITLSFIRQGGYHILGTTGVIKDFVKRCPTCRMLRARVHRPVMASLPKDRVTCGPPFTTVGLDIFGPFLLSSGVRTRRSPGSRKVWCTLYTCLSSRAVHVELMSAMDSVAFINSLRRFVALRGPCALIRSDQGSNLVGAKGQVEELNLTEAARAMAAIKVRWIMNPPHASNFGGVWERKIGQVRQALDYAMRHVKDHPLNFDEFATLIAEAVSVVNSTPLWPQSINPNDPPALSPNVLLTQKMQGETLLQSLEEDHLQAYGQERWKRVQTIANLFWKQWRDLYLAELNQRAKWTKESPGLKTGDIVLIKEGGRRCHWPMGRITKIEESHDPTTRRTRVRVARFNLDSPPKVLSRPSSELVLLQPITESQDE